LILSSVIKGEIEKKERERERAGGEEGELKREIEKKENCTISYPTSTRRHGNFAGVHTLLRIILSIIVQCLST
jgi:hypothetical protein